MPPQGNADHLIAALFRFGPTMIGGMGREPLTQTEIGWRQITTGWRLTGWEADKLGELSMEYLGEAQAAEKRDAPAPWQPQDAKPQVTELQAALRALAAL